MCVCVNLTQSIENKQHLFDSFITYMQALESSYLRSSIINQLRTDMEQNLIGCEELLLKFKMFFIPANKSFSYKIDYKRTIIRELTSFGVQGPHFTL